MKRSRLDRIDRNILKRLQSEGRVTNVELEKSVGISAPPCLRRVRALQEEGFIKGFYAEVDQAKLGYGVNVFAMVKLRSHAEDELTRFENFINNQEEVRECYMLAGDIDFLLKIVSKNWDTYQDFLTHTLTKAPNVDSVRSSLSVRPSKFKPGVPID